MWGPRSWEYHILETYGVRVKSWDSLFASKKKRVCYLTWSQDQLKEVREEGRLCCPVLGRLEAWYIGRS